MINKCSCDEKYYLLSLQRYGWFLLFGVLKGSQTADLWWKID